MEKEQNKVSKKKATSSSAEQVKKTAQEVVKKTKSSDKTADVKDTLSSSSLKIASPANRRNAKSSSTIHIKQVASHYGRISRQVASLKGLGLSRINQVVEREDTPEIRGMINRVKHLVEIIKV
jgi:large subunit ribosomal protein L30